MRLIDAYEQFNRIEDQFETALCEAQEGLADYRRSYDPYDGSVEFYDVPPELRFNEASQKVCHDFGFCTAFVNHLDGWETHYAVGGKVPVDGWRVNYKLNQFGEQP